MEGAMYNYSGSCFILKEIYPCFEELHHSGMYTTFAKRTLQYDGIKIRSLKKENEDISINKTTTMSSVT
jgi:hypothetical protein